MTEDNLTPTPPLLSSEERELLIGYKPFVLWFTGLSGSGKSTLAYRLERELLHRFGIAVVVLDGDSLRRGLNRDLGFSEADRRENIRRAGEIAKILYQSGFVTLVSLISPFQSERDSVRALFPQGAFWEVFVDCPLGICRSRDPKGLYQKALRGEIAEFTGISSPYETPLNPELRLDTSLMNTEECLALLVQRLQQTGMLQ